MLDCGRVPFLEEAERLQNGGFHYSILFTVQCLTGVVASSDASALSLAVVKVCR